jgi:hypothetical protein
MGLESLKLIRFVERDINHISVKKTEGIKIKLFLIGKYYNLYLTY